jgi:ADP-ribose pyrophosphatase
MPELKLATHLSKTFCHCPRCGNKNSQVGNNPFGCGHCDFVFYFSPVAAVGGIIVDAQNQILFVVRGKSPGKGKLGLPGGFADVGETLETSLAREVLEETSLVVDSVKYLCSFPNRYAYRGIAVDVLDTFFVCTVNSFETLSAQAGEIESFLITKPSEQVLDKLAFPSNRNAIERYLESL